MQIGYVTIGAQGAGIALLAYMTAGEWNLVVLALLLALIISIVIFATLTTAVERSVLDVRFGPGPIRRRIHLTEITDVRVVRNPWYYGWGIHWIGRGWLWNVSGLRAVELELRNGRRFRIGSDEPEALARALANR
jgi:hypothetical protein